MACFPDAQHKAQEELDRVVGSHRLPTVADEEDLPYIRCCIKEILRCMRVLSASIQGTLTDTS